MGDSVKKCEKALVLAGNYSVDPETYFEDEMGEEIAEMSLSAAAAIDIAMWDLRAKMDALSLAVVLGGSLKDLPTDYTIGIMDAKEAGLEAAMLAQEGFGSIKVKIGRSLSEDLDRVRAVRNSSGQSTKIYVDANGGYDPESAAKFWEKASEYKLDFFEQPVPADMLKEMASLRERGIRVCADESFTDEASLNKMIQLEAVDMVNIKLMKCGGLSPAIRLAGMAKHASLETMIGCMGDVGISIAAASHLACYIEPRQADLDSHLNIEQICNGPDVERGSIILPDRPGIGVGLKEGWQNWKT
jgi:L-alanine-DL-glutamate epimerase-like enolase superfamily enzyme